MYQIVLKFVQLLLMPHLCNYSKVSKLKLNLKLLTKTDHTANDVQVTASQKTLMLH